MNKTKVIGVIGAMEIEIEEFKNRYENISMESYGGFDIYSTNYKNKKIVFCYSKVGKVFSTMAATILISKYNIESLIFSGIAGALNDEYKTLDICIATKTCQHDIDITAFGHPKGFLSESGGVFVGCDKGLSEIARTVAEIEGLDLKLGVIATGDQFISSPSEKMKIKKEFDADMIEMEGGSVAVVASQMNIPFLITRTISDSASGDGLMEFNEFIEKAAIKNADFVFKIIKAI